MSDLFLLSPAQMSKIEPFFPGSHGVPRVDDRRVVSGIIYVLNMACSGRTLPRVTVRTRPYITVSGAGLNWACSTRFSVTCLRLTGHPIR